MMGYRIPAAFGITLRAFIFHYWLIDDRSCRKEVEKPDHWPLSLKSKELMKLNRRFTEHAPANVGYGFMRAPDSLVLGMAAVKNSSADFLSSVFVIF